jgi:hypothetical protein
MTAWSTLGRRRGDASGQSLMEMALLMPFLLLVAFGVVDVGYAMLDQHVVTKLTREGSNLISRNTSLEDAVEALKSMSTQPVDFSSRSKVILSVLKKGGTTGTANYDRIILYQRHEYGALGETSRLSTRGGGSFGGPPDYEAPNSDNATSLQVTNVPADLIAARGAMIYVTEIYTTHQVLTPLSRLGVSIPTTLYSIAYF